MSTLSPNKGAHDRCDGCAHPERLHDERIRSVGAGRCPTCSVCVADAESAHAATTPTYRCPRCDAPGMVLPFGAHAGVDASGEVTATWKHDDWSDDDDAECCECAFSGTVADFAADEQPLPHLDPADASARIATDRQRDDATERGAEMRDDTYHGWPNRETWSFHLWITNEQATYEEARRVARDAAADTADGVRNGRHAVADALREWWRETLDAARENGYSETLHAMRDEIGSVWRIDWLAVADALLEE